MKAIQKIQNILLLAIVLVTYNACTEPYALQSNNYQNYLVVEATLTNGLKKQEVKLTRTYRLEEREPTSEQNATVKVFGDDGSVFLFEEELLNGNSIIKIDCKWESFLLEFNIYYPLINDCEYMQIVGGAKGIGNWLLNKGIPCKMKLSDPKQLGCKLYLSY